MAQNNGYGGAGKKPLGPEASGRAGAEGRGVETTFARSPPASATSPAARSPRAGGLRRPQRASLLAATHPERADSPALGVSAGAELQGAAEREEGQRARPPADRAAPRSPPARPPGSLAAGAEPDPRRRPPPGRPAARAPQARPRAVRARAQLPAPGCRSARGRLPGPGEPATAPRKAAAGASQGPGPAGLAPAAPARAVRASGDSPCRQPSRRPTGRKSRPTAALSFAGPGYRHEPRLRHPVRLLPPPPLLQERRCPTAAPRPPLPHSPRPSTHSGSTAPPHPSGAGRPLAGKEKQAEPGPAKLPNHSEALVPASFSPPSSSPPQLYAVSRPLGAAGWPGH
ncbi:proline-rich protein 2-like [Heterocephalus glaber]|uniref:Proline-rich protein 2-like n=1 Tax=Heterocephalus glaber TaxID=10181 RepID=A0AAX6NXP4_HETGA|nr:proline-rich protein 2-like [Heterocephalus glaber]